MKTRKNDRWKAEVLELSDDEESKIKTEIKNSWPNFRSKWSESERKTLLEFYKTFGPNWSSISRFLNGKENSEIEQEFYKILKEVGYDYKNKINSIFDGKKPPRAIRKQDKYYKEDLERISNSDIWILLELADSDKSKQITNENMKRYQDEKDKLKHLSEPNCKPIWLDDQEAKQNIIVKPKPEIRVKVPEWSNTQHIYSKESDWLFKSEEDAKIEPYQCNSRSLQNIALLV